VSFSTWAWYLNSVVCGLYHPSAYPDVHCSIFATRPDDDIEVALRIVTQVVIF
jgi:hypothetical protein